METQTLQEKFDDLVKEYGAGAVITAIKTHSVTPLGVGDCVTKGCPVHYICNPNTGNCQLDVG